MAYTKTNWVDGTTEITAAHLNNMETQHENAIVDARVESAEPLRVQTVSSLPSAGNPGRIVFHNGRFRFDTGSSWQYAADDMPNDLGAWTATSAQPGISQITRSIAEGYHNGNGYIIIPKAVIGDIKVEMERTDVEIHGSGKSWTFTRSGLDCIQLDVWYYTPTTITLTIKIDGSTVFSGSVYGSSADGEHIGTFTRGNRGGSSTIEITHNHTYRDFAIAVKSAMLD